MTDHLSLSVRRRTSRFNPWIFQTAALGPLSFMRRREVRDSAYETEDGPYKLLSVSLKLGRRWRLKLEDRDA